MELLCNQKYWKCVGQHSIQNVAYMVICLPPIFFFFQFCLLPAKKTLLTSCEAHSLESLVWTIPFFQAFRTQSFIVRGRLLGDFMLSLTLTVRGIMSVYRWEVGWTLHTVRGIMCVYRWEVGWSLKTVRGIMCVYRWEVGWTLCTIRGIMSVYW